MTDPAPDHAVVIGASVAGLLAASVLSRHYSLVTVYDRDALPAEPGHRRGVPQDRQLHALHARGTRALCELLPGFWEDMIAAGGVVADAQDDAHWYLDDYLLKPAPSGLEGITLSRPALEWLIRSRVAKLPGVTIVAGADVTGLVMTGAPGAAGRVTGARVQAAQAAQAASPRSKAGAAWEPR